jgi:hypothetical protein
LLTLIGVIALIGLSLFTRSLRQQVGERQQIINQGLAVNQLDIRLANSLATLATRDSDEKAKLVLLRNGITLRPVEPVRASPEAGDK